ncbi:hypothetical protein IJ596_02825 [bacterium]|nr:hypothetical protein [bacterium]
MISKIGVSPAFTSRVSIAGLAYDEEMKDKLNDSLLRDIKELENNGNDDDVTLVSRRGRGYSVLGCMDMVVTEKTKNGYRATLAPVYSDEVLSAYKKCKDGIKNNDINKDEFLYQFDTIRIKYRDIGWNRDKKSKVHIIPAGKYGFETGLYSPGLKKFADEIEQNGKDEKLTIGPCSSLGNYKITLTRKNKDGKTISAYSWYPIGYTNSYSILSKTYKQLSDDIEYGMLAFANTVPEKFVDYVI